jgi:hypothetical protein
MQFFTERALGLRTGLAGLTAYDRVYMDISYEIADGMDAEDPPRGGIKVPVTSVVRRAAHDVYDACAVYFEELRQSLRNVLLDIDKYNTQRALFHNDEFWRRFVVKATAAKTVEPQLWDLKEMLTVWRAPAGDARERAKVSFAEDVAALANTSGGVLLVGVSDSPPRKIVGIGNSPREIEDRLKVARDVLAKHLKYDRELASFRQVVVPDDGGVDRTCLAVVVSQASEVVGVHDGQGHYTYPARRETGITRESPSHLAMERHVKSDNRDFLADLEQFVG